MMLIVGCQSMPDPSSETSAPAIMIPVFDNDSFEPGAEGKLTRAVREEFLTRPGYRIARHRGQAGAVLEGRILSISLEPLSFDRSHRVAEYRVTVSGEFRLVSPADQVILWKNDGLTGSAEYPVNPDPAVSRSAQDLAISEALKRLAEEIWVEIDQIRAHPDLFPAPKAPDHEPAPPAAHPRKPTEGMSAP